MGTDTQSKGCDTVQRENGAHSLEICTQLTRTDGQWVFTGHAVMHTEEAADSVIKILEIIKPLLAENRPAVAPTAGEEK